MDSGSILSVKTNENLVYNKEEDLGNHSFIFSNKIVDDTFVKFY